jgi:hypothetical protein
LNVDDPVWDHSTFSFNGERLFDEGVAQRLFDNTVLLAQLKQLTSNEHFSVDGDAAGRVGPAQELPTERRRRDDDDFRGKPRSNDTHEFVAGLTVMIEASSRTLRATPQVVAARSAMRSRQLPATPSASRSANGSSNLLADQDILRATQTDARRITGCKGADALGVCSLQPDRHWWSGGVVGACADLMRGR